MERSTAGNQPQSSSSSPPPRYKGVRMRKWGSWVAEVRFPNSRERLWLGSYPTAEQAARAFDAAVYCLRGPGAAFNFPDRPPVIPSADKLSKEEIKAAAERFANEEPRWAGKAQEEEGAGEKVTEVEGSSGTIAEPVEEMSMEHCSPAAAGVAEWWNEEDEDACWNAAASSSDDIYSSSPLWNF